MNKKPRRRIAVKDLEKWMDLRAKNYTYQEIAEETGYSRQLISRYLKGYKEQRDEIEELKKEIAGLIKIRNQDNRSVKKLEKRVSKIEDFLDRKYGK